MRSLRFIEVPLDSHGNLLSSLFMNRLPQELQLIVNREVGDAEWRIDDILSIEETELSARERERESIYAITWSVIWCGVIFSHKVCGR